MWMQPPKDISRPKIHNLFSPPGILRQGGGRQSINQPHHSSHYGLNSISTASHIRPGSSIWSFWPTCHFQWSAGWCSGTRPARRTCCCSYGAKQFPPPAPDPPAAPHLDPQAWILCHSFSKSRPPAPGTGSFCWPTDSCLLQRTTCSCTGHRSNISCASVSPAALKYLYSTADYGISFHSDASNTIQVFNHCPPHHDKEAFFDASPPFPLHMLTISLHLVGI
jgi:hypothetical protein